MYSKGVMWLDDCRIPFVEGDEFIINRYEASKDTFGGYIDKESAEGKYITTTPDQKGRFTPNLLVCDDMLNDGKISVSEGGKTTRDTAHFGGGTFKMEGYGDKGTNSRYYDLDLWFDKMLERL